MRQRAEWMTRMDDEVLEVLSSSQLVLSPAILGYNLDSSREAVNRRLSKLAEHGMVERVERGKYHITDLGEGYLAGDIDAADL